MKEKEQLWDVVIVECTTRVIDSIVGNNMRRDQGFHNAEKRADIMAERINHDYFVEIVEAGKFKKGDKLP